MIITYHGLESFKIVHGSTTAALNPVSKTSTHKSTSFGADIVLVSLNHSDMNGVDTVSRGDKEPFIISGPGEYEVNDVFIRGFATPTVYSGLQWNTTYLISMEGMRLCYLGALSATELPKELDEALEEIDVLFVPIGNNGVLSPKDGHKVAVHIEPRIVIPMHYDTRQLNSFLKEGGETNGKLLDKLTLKPKDLIGQSGNVVTLTSV